MSERGRGTGVQGFTLVELLVVVAIIGLLVGLLVPNLLGAREQAKIQTCKTNLRNIGFACERYAEVFSIFPTGAHQLGIDKLVKGGFVDNPKVLICPSTVDKPLSGAGVTGQRISDAAAVAALTVGGPPTGGSCSYYYTAKTFTTMHSGALPLASDDAYKDMGGTSSWLTNDMDNHPDGVNILFKDNHVDYIERYVPNTRTVKPDFDQYKPELQNP